MDHLFVQVPASTIPVVWHTSGFLASQEQQDDHIPFFTVRTDMHPASFEEITSVDHAIHFFQAAQFYCLYPHTHRGLVQFLWNNYYAGNFNAVDDITAAISEMSIGWEFPRGQGSVVDAFNPAHNGQDIIVYCALHPHLALVLDVVFADPRPCGHVLSSRAAAQIFVRKGNLNRLMQLGDHCVYDLSILRAAAHSGNLGVLQHVFAKITPSLIVHEDFETLRYAGKAGSVECIRFLLEKWGFTSQILTVVFRATIEGGQLEAFQYVLPALSLAGANVFNHLPNIAEFGQIQMLEQLHAASPDAVREASNTMLRMAIRYSNLQMVTWLCEHGADSRDRDLAAEAAKQGKMDILKYLCENGHRVPYLCDGLEIISSIPRFTFAPDACRYIIENRGLEMRDGVRLSDLVQRVMHNATFDSEQTAEIVSLLVQRPEFVIDVTIVSIAASITGDKMMRIVLSNGISSEVNRWILCNAKNWKHNPQCIAFLKEKGYLVENDLDMYETAGTHN